MKILQDPLLIISAPIDVQIVLGVFFAIAAVTLFVLAVEEGVYPTVRHWITDPMTADFWIRRQRRRLRFQPTFSTPFAYQ